MPYQIEYAYTSHIGNVRGNNEDNFWCCGETMDAENQGTTGVIVGKAAQSQTPLLAVFDGMGGESCGEIAAYLAADACGKHYQEFRTGLRRQPEQFLEEICRNMNHAVCKYSAENRIRTMGTTAAMLAVGKDAVYACNVGDSRLYQFDESGFRQISTDHVLKGGPFGKAPLTQYVGVPEEHMGIEPYICQLECRPGMRYLLCSDGMTDMLSDGEIADILTREISVREAVEILLERTLMKGGRDNVTIILCEVKETEQKNRLFQWFENKRKQYGGRQNEKSDEGSGL